MKSTFSIVIVDTDRAAADTLSAALMDTGYTVTVMSAFSEAKQSLAERPPHLIIIDPARQGAAALDMLKSDIAIQNIPIIIISARHSVEDIVSGLNMGADDYIVKPFDVTEIIARAGSAIRRNYQNLDANPLTRLPGNISIMHAIEDRISNETPMAIGYIDLDYFKAFNDSYGFSKGDEVIRFTAQIIRNTIRMLGNKDDFVGHIGGDDFIIIVDPGRIDEICKHIVTTFDQAIAGFYKPEDRDKGKIVVENRRGRLEEYPFMSVSVAAMTNAYKPITHIGQVSAVTSELKKYAKSFKGSTYVKDRRDRPRSGSALVFGGTERLAREDWKGKVDIAGELERIIRSLDIRVLFQPVMDMVHDIIIGHEAFCHGPIGSLLEYPAALFRVARQVGLETVLDQICRERIFAEARLLKGGLLLFVNIKPASLENREFQNEDFLNSLERKPNDIIFEIEGIGTPESLETHREALQFFQKKGFKIGVDNFGAGSLSALGTIAEMRPSFVKLDISLMRGIHADSIKQHTLRALMSIFTQLGISTIAEKVEQQEEYDFLVASGIRLMQGFLFAKPIRIDVPVSFLDT